MNKETDSTSYSLKLPESYIDDAETVDVVASAPSSKIKLGEVYISSLRHSDVPCVEFVISVSSSDERPSVRKLNALLHKDEAEPGWLSELDL